MQVRDQELPGSEGRLRIKAGEYKGALASPLRFEIVDHGAKLLGIRPDWQHTSVDRYRRRGALQHLLPGLRAIEESALHRDDIESHALVQEFDQPGFGEKGATIAMLALAQQDHARVADGFPDGLQVLEVRVGRIDTPYGPGVRL
jgi:hypothetical protein